MHRLLATTAVALSLAGCAGSTGTATITTAETDLLLIDNSVIQIVNELRPTNPTLAAGLTNATPTTPGTMPLDIAKAGLTALLAGTSPPVGAQTPAQIVGVLSADLGTLAPIVNAAIPRSTPYVIAAQVLLVTASGLLGSPVSPVVTVPPLAAMAARQVSVALPSPDDARKLLKAYTGTP